MAVYLLLLVTLGAQADQVTQRLAHGLARTVQVLHVPPPGRLVVTLPPADVFDAPDTFAEVVDLRNGQVVARSANLGDETLPFLSEALAAARHDQPMARVVEPATNSMHVYSVPLRRGGRLAGGSAVARGLGADERWCERRRRVLAVSGGGALRPAALIGGVLAERARAPIAGFARAGEAIGGARGFSRRVIHRGPQDEVGHLAITV